MAGISLLALAIFFFMRRRRQRSGLEFGQGQQDELLSDEFRPDPFLTPPVMYQDSVQMSQIKLDGVESTTVAQTSAQASPGPNPHHDFPPPDYGQVFSVLSHLPNSSALTLDAPSTSAAVSAPVSSVPPKS